MQARGFAGQQICGHKVPLKITSAMAVFHKNCEKRKGNLAFLTPHQAPVYSTPKDTEVEQRPFSEAPCIVIKNQCPCGVRWMESNTLRNTNTNTQERMPDSI
jgi:hypothetical protein